MRRHAPTLGICLLLALGSFALYAPSLDFGFVAYDDLTVLQAHPNLYGQPSLARCLYEIFVGYFPREEPLLVRDVSWAIDAHLFGFASGFGYHLGNVLLNTADVVLLFLFLLHATRRRIFAGVCAGIFATLAIHVEPVGWVMGRKDVLAAFFTLLALLAQSVALQKDDLRLRRLAWAGGLLLYVLAVLSKLSAITLVAVLAAHRILAPYLDGRRNPRAALGWRTSARELLGYLPHAVVGAGLSRWYGRVLYDYQAIGGRGPSPLSLQHAKTLAIFVPLSIGRTVEHVLLAAEHSISYLRPNVALALSLGDWLVTGAAVVTTLALLVLTFRYRKDLLFFVVAFLLWLLPYANVEYIGIWVADRYAYLASSCVIALLVRLVMDGLDRMGNLRRPLLVGMCACATVFAAYGVLATRHHLAAFRSERTLWEYENALPHPSMLSYAALAKSLVKQAEGTADPAVRRVCLTDARIVARAGLRHYRTMRWLPAKGYFIAARTELAGLYETLGRVAALAGASLDRRLEYLRMAGTIYPSASTDLLLAEALFEQARPKHEPNLEPNLDDIARESLTHWRDYARKAWPDPHKHPDIRATFEAYRREFPALAPEVGQALVELERPQ